MTKPQITKEWLDSFYDRGIDPENRVLHLYGDIGEDSISNLVKSIYYLDSLGDDPIELFISSVGGSVYDMFALYDVTRSTRCPIHTVGVGYIMSAAVLLVAAGTKGKRYSMPHCSYMVHEGLSELGEGRIASHKKVVDHLKQLDETWYDLMAKHTNLSVAQWKRKCNIIGDYYFTADQAIEFGVVDHLWSEKP